MKKIASLLALVAMLLNNFSFAVLAEDQVSIFVNDKQIEFETPPFLENGRTLVPMRGVFEQLGAQVTWSETTKTVSVIRGADEILVTVDSNEILKNLSPSFLDVPAKLVEGKVFIPLRAISELLSCDVKWDAVEYTITITNGNTAIEDAPAIDYTFVDTAGMTDLQKAVVITAESFYLRGNRAQYDMGALSNVSTYPERRLVKEKSPEDYTVQNIGYTDCSGFSYDVFWNALEMMITTVPNAWTKPYVQNTEHLVLKHSPELEPENFDTPEEIEAHKKEFLDTLQPGDLIVYRYAGNSGGHAMLYAGNGMMFHSTGSSYTRGEKKENYEAGGTYLYDSVSESLLDNSEDRRYLFNKHTYVILRPLNNFTGEIPEKTLARMDKMRGVVAEKLATRTIGQTANPGEEVTFTFVISNYDKVDKTLMIQDVLPKNTIYVSGAEEVEGETLSWNAYVPAGKTVTFSYTLQIKNDPALIGETVVSNSNIEGIAVNCPAIHIEKTLTKAQQQDLISAVSSQKDSQLRDLELADAIYKKAFGKSILEGYTSADVLNGVFEDAEAKLGEKYANSVVLNKSGAFADMLVPNLYGGYRVVEEFHWGEDATNRIRMITADKLIVGDIIVSNDAEEISAEVYLFTGDGVLNLSNMEKLPLEFLDEMMGYRHFVVIRPSMSMK